MDGSPLLLLIIAVIALVVFVRLTGRKNDLDGDVAAFPTFRKQQLRGFPYEVQRNFLSPAELSFFQVLRSVVGQSAVVCPKVSLGDVFWVKVQDTSQFRAYRNKIDRKHIDFLLCNPATMQPLVAVELDDKSHERADRQERDVFVDQVFKAAKLQLLHVPAKQAYTVSELAAQIAPYLTAALPYVAASIPAPATANASPLSADNQAPRCPKCGSKMILRTAKSGANAGSRFWGCSNYPNCRGIISIPSA